MSIQSTNPNRLTAAPISISHPEDTRPRVTARAKTHDDSGPGQGVILWSIWLLVTVLVDAFVRTRLIQF